MKLWIARDKSGKLGLYREKPVWMKKGNRYDWFGMFGCYIWNDKLPEVTFENSPQEVELKLKNELSFEEMEELIDDLI